MTRLRVRLALFFAAGSVLGGVLLWGLAGLPAFGHYNGAYGLTVNRLTVPELHVTNAVAAVTYDVRGFDTLGEEMILFAAVLGVALLLREVRAGSERGDDREEAEGPRLLGLAMVPVVVLVGLWVAAFGYVTPGGGFQGGVVLAGAALLLWVAGSYRDYRRATPVRLVDLAEGIGAGGYVVVGLAAMVAGLAFLEAILGPGATGTLKSGGSIPFLNWAAALEVAAANLLLFNEFLEEYLARR